MPDPFNALVAPLVSERYLRVVGTIDTWLEWPEHRAELFAPVIADWVYLSQDHRDAMDEDVQLAFADGVPDAGAKAGAWEALALALPPFPPRQGSPGGRFTRG